MRRAVLFWMLFAAACAEAPTQRPTAPDSADVEAPEAESADTTWSDSPVDVSGTGREIAVVSDIRSGRHGGFDRFVLEFEGEDLPGYHVAYVDGPVTECGSGEVREMGMQTVLEIRMEPARAYTEEGRPTVDHGPRQAGLPTLREVHVSCDFEAVFTVVLGVSGLAGFRVSEAASPARLVIELEHLGG